MVYEYFNYINNIIVIINYSNYDHMYHTCLLLFVMFDHIKLIPINIKLLSIKLEYILAIGIVLKQLEHHKYVISNLYEIYMIHVHVYSLFLIQTNVVSVATSCWLMYASYIYTFNFFYKNNFFLFTYEYNFGYYFGC